MLKEVILENWKSFRKATLHLGPFTVLIGRAESGKSNVLESLTFLGRTAQKKNIQESFEGDSIHNAIRGGTQGATCKPADQFTLRAVVQPEAEQDYYTYSMTVEPESYLVVAERLVCTQQDSAEAGEEIVLIDTNIDSDVSMNTLNVHHSKGIVGRIDRMIGFSGLFTSLGRLEERLPEQAMPVSQVLQNIFVLDPIPATMRTYSPLSEALYNDASNIAGLLAKLPSEQKQHIESLLSHYLSQLPACNIRRIWSKPDGYLSKDAMLYCEKQSRSRGPIILSDACTMTDGTLRFIALFTALLLRPAGSLLAVEDVDHDLHPSQVQPLMQLLREVARRRGVHLLVTARNGALLDGIAEEHMPLVNVCVRDATTGEGQIVLLENVADFPMLMQAESVARNVARNVVQRRVRPRARKSQ